MKVTIAERLTALENELDRVRRLAEDSHEMFDHFMQMVNHLNKPNLNKESV